MPKLSTFGRAIQLCGLTQSEAAKFTNCSPKTIRKWCSGEAQPSALAWKVIIELYSDIQLVAFNTRESFIDNGIPDLAWRSVAAAGDEEFPDGCEEIAGTAALLDAAWEQIHEEEFASHGDDDGEGIPQANTEEPSPPEESSPTLDHLRQFVADDPSLKGRTLSVEENRDFIARTFCDGAAWNDLKKDEQRGLLFFGMINFLGVWVRGRHGKAKADEFYEAFEGDDYAHLIDAAYLAINDMMAVFDSAEASIRTQRGDIH
ncbi:MAG: helix-turn-helix transcriptional regulator [Aestuariivita sp.]|nr:helix-turn-helix transcriptional regulator [Aestuariivita sp.]MCY4345368.1 helix-turn-helix transcriptional regulator [Aestuariivita sp.]